MLSGEMAGRSACSPELLIGLIVCWAVMVTGPFYVGGLQGGVSFWSLVVSVTFAVATWDRDRKVSAVFLTLTACSGLWLWRVMSSFLPHL